jgi:glucose-6-phosphate-specific signal transduction histidine kinase
LFTILGFKYFLQESLTNIQKHAQADRVTIESTIVTMGKILEICAHGKGFDLDRSHPEFGLRNMQERVQCLGGDLHLTKGTVKNYVTNILTCLNLGDRLQVALWVAQNLTDSYTET